MAIGSAIVPVLDTLFGWCSIVCLQTGILPVARIRCCLTSSICCICNLEIVEYNSIVGSSIIFCRNMLCTIDNKRVVQFFCSVTSVEVSTRQGRSCTTKGNHPVGVRLFCSKIPFDEFLVRTADEAQAGHSCENHINFSHNLKNLKVIILFIFFVFGFFPYVGIIFSQAGNFFSLAKKIVFPRQGKFLRFFSRKCFTHVC